MSSRSDYVYGIHAVKALIDTEPERILEVFALKGREDKRINIITDALAALDIKITQVSKKVLDERSCDGVHQGILARVRAMPELGDHELESLLDKEPAPFLLILDDITDPHNLGACLRVCDTAGVTAIIAPKDKSAPLTGIARKVACGAAETIPVFYITNLARVLRQLKDKGITVVGTAGETDKLMYDVDMTGPLAVVMGAEDTGMRRLTRENCDSLVKIPMFGHVTSLNVSVATGIVLYEAVRQRIKAGKIQK